MRNELNLPIPFFQTNNASNQPELIASRHNNEGHGFGALCPLLLTPEFVIPFGTPEGVDTIKLVKVADGTEITVTPGTNKVYSWQDEDDNVFTAYTGGDPVVVLECAIYQYQVTFTGSSLIWYSDYIEFSDRFSMVNLGRRHVWLEGLVSCDYLAGIKHNNGSEEFKLNVFLEAQEIHTQHTTEQDVVADLNFDETIQSTVTKRSHLLVIKNCHPPVYDALIRLQHYVENGLYYRNGIDNQEVAVGMKVKSMVVEEPDYNSGGTYSPTVRIRISYDDPMTTIDCCENLPSCPTYDVPRPTSTGVSSILHVDMVDTDFPEDGNFWIVIEYGTTGVTPLANSVTILPADVSTFFASGEDIPVVPGDYDFRVIVQNHNCGFASTVETQRVNA